MALVFVYGTLRAGEVNDLNEAARRHGLPAPRLVGSGSVPGRLYDFGSYPGYVPAALEPESAGLPGGPRVVGDIYEIDEALIPVLDEIEEVYPGQATLFVRTEQEVACADGKRRCLLYPVGAEAVRSLPEIEGGDWVAYRRARVAAG